MQPPYPAPVTEWHNDTYDAINPSRPELSQAGKTVIITGAGQGIGREIVKAFALAGASNIHILGRQKQTLEETKNIVASSHGSVNIVVHVVDIVDEAATVKAAKDIGSWDVLVANAGQIITPTTIKDSDANEWWRTFEVNVKGSYVLARAFVPFKKSGGTIVAVSTAFAFLPLAFMAGHSAYSISKMGTSRFYEFLAAENPDLNMYVLHPGIVRTSVYDKGKLEFDSTLDAVELPAHFMVWLASPEAKPLSGKFLFANWDVEQLTSKVAERLAVDPIYLTTSLGGFPFNN